MWHVVIKSLIGYTMASVAEDRQHRKHRHHKQNRAGYTYRVPAIIGNQNMSNMFKKAKRDAALESNYKERVGGFTPLPSGLYEATIKRAYAVSTDKSDAAAVRIELTVTSDTGKTEMTETFWVMSAEGETFRVDKRTGERRVIPEWMEMNNLASLATDGEFKFPDLETDDYSYRVEKEGKESFIKTECYPELEGFEVLVAITHRKRYKQVKQGDKYVYIDEVYETNTVDRFFDLDGFTAAELDREAEEPSISTKWEEKNAGKVIEQRRPAELDQQTRSARGGSSDDTSSRRGASGQRKSRFS